MKNYNICILLFFSLFILVGCKKDNNFEGGFIYDNNSKELNPFFFAYSAKHNEFDINDITFNIFYGYRYKVYSPSDNPEDNRKMSTVIIARPGGYTSNELEEIDKGINTYILKRIDDFTDKNKYVVSINKKVISFPSTDTITIPKELFKEKNGKINIGICVTYGKYRDPDYEGYYKSVDFKYEIIDEVIKLYEYKL